MMKILINQTFYEPVPAGRYVAVVTNIEEAESQFGPQLKFTFELQLDGNDEPRTIIGWTSQKFSTKSKLYTWTKAILGGGTIERSYTFNSDDLIGRNVYVDVVVEEGDQGTYNKILRLSAYIKQSPPPAPTQPYQDEGNW